MPHRGLPLPALPPDPWHTSARLDIAAPQVRADLVAIWASADDWAPRPAARWAFAAAGCALFLGRGLVLRTRSLATMRMRTAPAGIGYIINRDTPTSLAYTLMGRSGWDNFVLARESSPCSPRSPCPPGCLQAAHVSLAVTLAQLSNQ